MVPPAYKNMSKRSDDVLNRGYPMGFSWATVNWTNIDSLLSGKWNVVYSTVDSVLSQTSRRTVLHGYPLALILHRKERREDQRPVWDFAFLVKDRPAEGWEWRIKLTNPRPLALEFDKLKGSVANPSFRLESRPSVSVDAVFAFPGGFRLGFVTQSRPNPKVVDVSLGFADERLEGCVRVNGDRVTGSVSAALNDCFDVAAEASLGHALPRAAFTLGFAHWLKDKTVFKLKLDLGMTLGLSYCMPFWRDCTVTLAVLVDATSPLRMEFIKMGLAVDLAKETFFR